MSVSDLRRSVWFYREVLGIPLHEAAHDSENSGGHAAYSWTDGAFIHFALYPKHEPERPVATAVQIGFRAAGIEAVHQRVLASGARVVVEPRREPWGKTARYLDPDGNIVSITDQRGGGG